MIGGVTRHMLPHLPGVPHIHVNRPLEKARWRPVIPVLHKKPMESANLKTKTNEPMTVSQQCEVYCRNVIKKRVLFGSVKKIF